MIARLILSEVQKLKLDILRHAGNLKLTPLIFFRVVILSVKMNARTFSSLIITVPNYCPCVDRA